MTHLVSCPEQKESLPIQNILTDRGLQTCSLTTSQGIVYTALNVNEQEIADDVGIKTHYSLIKPEIPYFLASKAIKDIASVIKITEKVFVGGSQPTVIAGPCSVESEEQIMQTAHIVKEMGGEILRGGVYKPRSSPYSFQGMGEAGLKLLRKAGDANGLPVITEILDSENISLVAEYSDILQVGTRNCQNFSLLKKLGKINKPVLLKRGLMNTVEEFLLSAEYILAGGNMNVILCERGIRTFETATRNTLDISAIPILKQTTHLPVIVDPSHAAGDWRLIEPLSMAAIAAGADGIMLEVHPEPKKALSDGKQSLKPERFQTLMQKLKPMISILNNEF